MKTEIEITIKIDEIILTNSCGDTFIIKDTKINEDLIDFIQRCTEINDRWYNIRNTCGILNISTRTLQTYRDNNVIKFAKFGGKIYFRESDIKNHFNKHIVKKESNEIEFRELKQYVNSKDSIAVLAEKLNTTSGILFKKIQKQQWALSDKFDLELPSGLNDRKMIIKKIIDEKMP